MSSEVVLKVQDISKRYEIYEAPHHRLLQTLLRGRKQFYKEFWALRDISFEVKKGECLGIVGRNGSGKSTLLQIIAGTLAPTNGSVSVNGKVAALLELGSGFNPEFTGRENVYMNGAIMGLSRPEMDKKFDEIASFADIGKFIDQPVRVYSSGMYVRLAFAAAINVNPDILIIDEALSVGDGVFIHRCMNRFHELRAAGTTVLFVSHDMTAMRLLTSRVLWLKDGQQVQLGSTTNIVDSYISFMNNQRVVQQNKSPQNTGISASISSQDRSYSAVTIEQVIPNIDTRLGDQSCTFLGVGAYDDKMNPIKSIYHGEFMTLRATLVNHTLPADTLCVFGFTIRNSRGIDIASSNNEAGGFSLFLPPPDRLLNVQARFQLPLLHPGIYSLRVSCSYYTGTALISADTIPNAIQIDVTGKVRCYVLLALDAEYSAASVGCA
ncbi:MAG: ABC transporter ATP-binding protein [Candidatus Omnitrophota bacterium]